MTSVECIQPTIRHLLAEREATLERTAGDNESEANQLELFDPAPELSRICAWGAHR